MSRWIRRRLITRWLLFKRATRKNGVRMLFLNANVIQAVQRTVNNEIKNGGRFFF